MNNTDDQSGTDDLFNNLADVLRYLQGQGFKLSKPSLYRHNKEGKILPNTTGKFQQKYVDRYARTFLKVTATGKRHKDITDDLQREKLEQELKNLKLKNEREKFNFEKEQGLYVPRSQMDIEVASFIAVLVSAFKNLITSKTAEWIAMSGGDHKKTGEFITKAISDIDDLTNSIANVSEYEVVFEAEQETT